MRLYNVVFFIMISLRTHRDPSLRPSTLRESYSTRHTLWTKFFFIVGAMCAYSPRLITLTWSLWLFTRITSFVNSSPSPLVIIYILARALNIRPANAPPGGPRHRLLPLAK